VSAIAAVGQHWAPAAQLDPQQVYCMARTLHGEARGSFVDQPLIAFVVINRSRATGKTICKTVRAKSQFVGYHQPAKAGPEWDDAVTNSIYAMAGVTVDVSGGATHFYNYEKNQSPPSWAMSMTEIGRTEKHRYMMRR
jgi:spore germination cell wall hydrolase CwlJ-like protein